MIAAAYDDRRQLPGDRWLMEVVGWTWRVKLSLSLSLDLMRELRERAEEEAIHVFARNLKDLLLAAPAGSRADDGARSRHPHRRQGRGRRWHRQAAGDDDGLSVPAEERRARHAGRARQRSSASTRSS